MTPLLFLALDVSTADEALSLVRRAGDNLTHVKIGLQLFSAKGPEIVRSMRDMEKKVFLDLKLHDIPETVQLAARMAVVLGVDFFTTHVAGGKKMLEAAVEGVRGSKTKVLAVTVLTSLDLDDLAAVGTSVVSVRALVVKRALLAQEAGCHGVIASPLEARAIRDAVGVDSKFLIITPGIRLQGGEKGDQKRVGTARGAIEDGASGIVVGRPIRDAADPAQVVDLLLSEMNGR